MMMVLDGFGIHRAQYAYNIYHVIIQRYSKQSWLEYAGIWLRDIAGIMVRFINQLPESQPLGPRTLGMQVPVRKKKPRAGISKSSKIKIIQNQISLQNKKRSATFRVKETYDL
jgi:hypothetical protein